MTTALVRTLVVPAIIAAVAANAQGCGRTSLRGSGVQNSSTPDARASTTTATDGATSSPMTLPTGDGGCPDGFTACGRGAATRCYDLTRSADHCGQCGNACAPGIACQSSNCRQYRCQGPLTFKALPVISTDQRPPQVPVLGDFDRDGVLDFVGPTATLAPGALWRGKGDGTFEAQPLASANAATAQVAAADLNGDGWLDLVTVTGIPQPRPPLHSEGAVIVQLGNGDPATRFASATSYPTQPVPLDFLLADVDADGYFDVVTATPDRLTIWRGTASGSLVDPADISVGAAGNFLVAIDWNQDGVLDLLFGGATLRMLLGRGDGTFGQEIACGLALPVTNYPPSAPTLAEFDHDQKPDLVVSSKVLLGMNGCNFTTQVPISGDPVGVADLDGDGNADIVTLFNSPAVGLTMTLSLGDGRGGFAAPVLLPDVAMSAGATLTGDLNNDGKLDMIITRPDGWQVLLNTCP